MKRRILLVDDEVAVLLTMKAILEISGFEVDTAASGREGRSKLHTREYHMVITDMRMESDAAGAEVITAARSAPYHPAVALLTAFPVADEDWQEMGADKMLVKPMHVKILLQQIESLFATHESKLARQSPGVKTTPTKAAVKKAPAKKKLAVKALAGKSIKKPAAKSSVSKSTVAKGTGKSLVGVARKAAAKTAMAKKKPAEKAPARKTPAKQARTKK